jgi:serine protease AprX
MRRNGLSATLFILLALLTAALVAPMPAAAGKNLRRKLDPSLIAMLARTRNPNARFHVIVLGRNLDGARTDAGAGIRHRLHAIRGEAITVKAGKLLELAGSDGVLRVVPDRPMLPDTIGTPVSFPSLTTLYPGIIGMQNVWNGGYTGAGIGIAVLDSGVQAGPDFGTRLTQVLLPGQTATGDAYGHGTFVAGVAAGSSPDGRYVGVAPGAKVYGIRVAGSDSVLSSDVIAGLDWVLANHLLYNIRVVNISLSEAATSSYLADPLDTALERVWQNGVTVVVSSGNRGAGAISYAPANDPYAITVGATDTNDTATVSDDTVASFSSSGTTQDGYVKPEILAPGRKILSVFPLGTTLAGLAPAANILAGGYGMMSGTSFAAPQVAGAAALLLEAHPAWTPDQIKAALLQTAQSMTGPTKLLSVSAVVALTGTPSPANQGLVQSTYGLTTTATAIPNTASWNTASWNTASWNTAAWNYAAWD